MSIKHVMAAVVLFAAGGSAMAETEAELLLKDVTLADIQVPAKDTNGDGCIDPSEVTPGGQLAKRFATRDTNHDGKLCKDEYFVP